MNVSDVPASVLWFERLGWQRTFTYNAGGMIIHAALENQQGPAHFAGLCANSPEQGKGPTIFLCQNAQGARDPRPCPNPAADNYGAVWMSWWVPNVDAAHRDCLLQSVEIIRPPVNEPWGVREFLIRHADGHYFRISGPTT